MGEFDGPIITHQVVEIPGIMIVTHHGRLMECLEGFKGNIVREDVLCEHKTKLHFEYPKGTQVSDDCVQRMRDLIKSYLEGEI